MHPYGKPGDPHYPPKSSGLSRYQYQGSDLSSSPEDAMDPRPRSQASNRPRPNEPIQELPNSLSPVPEMHEGTLESARRSGMQPQPGSMNLLELLRKLGIL